MTAVQLLALGVVATVLAAARLFTWTSLGLSVGAQKLEAREATRATIAVLAGACLTMLVYAVFASAGQLRAAVIADAVIAVVAVRYAGLRAFVLLREAFRRAIPESGSGRAAFAALAVLLWVVAIGPPRDGDVMHYHLAHIRQIIAFGVWRQLPICWYGIPFGWSLTYLPFEWAGLPQTAHLVNAGAWMLTWALCVESAEQPSVARAQRWPDVTRWLLVGLTLSPIIMKASTTAMADAFTIMVVAVTVILLIQWPRLGAAGAVALGFAAFVGLTTRYQAAAVAIAVTGIVVVDAIRRPESRRLVPPFMVGALAALLAASPFYLANQVTLGSPVWPFGASLMTALRSAPGTNGAGIAHLGGLCATRAVIGGWKSVPGALVRLLWAPTAFPIPLLLAGATPVVLAAGPARLRRVAGFILLFLATWCIVQPRLEPRFSIYLTAAAVICAVPVADRLLRSRAAAAVRFVGATALVSLAMVGVLYARDYLVLAVTGDIARFHHATWYWPAYDWANRNTPDSARFVLVLYDGHTYPLHRWNVSADPASSAILPWASVANSCDLAAFLRRERAGFVFNGPDVWSGLPISERVGSTISDAAASGMLVPVKRFNVPIVYGRMAGLERRADVVLYRVDQKAIQAHCP